MNTGIMKLVGEVVQLNPDRSRPIHLIVRDSARTSIASRLLARRVLACGVAWQIFASSKAIVSMLSTPDREVTRKAKLLSSRTILNSFSSMMEPSESMAVKSHSVPNWKKRYQATSSHHERPEPLKASDRPFRLHHRYDPNTQVSRSFSFSGMNIPSFSLDPVPVVLIVVEGGPNTVRTGESDQQFQLDRVIPRHSRQVHEAVVQNNIPAVFIDGTGRCCNLFAKALRLYNDYRQTFGLAEDTSQYVARISSWRKPECVLLVHSISAWMLATF